MGSGSGARGGGGGTLAWDDPRVQSLGLYRRDSVEMNNELRSGRELTGQNKETADGMDATMAPLEANGTFYRGSSGLGELDGTPIEDLAGKTITDAGFLSTSASKWEAEGFAGLYGEPPVVMTIHASKGAPVVNMNKRLPYADVTGEEEYVFGRGSRYAIDSVHFDGDYYRVEGRLIA